jgi:TonB family protein
MTEAWKEWEGQVADGKFHLRQYLGGSERGPVFATEFGEQKSAIKLIPADAKNAEAQLARWALAANLNHPHLLRMLQTGRCQVGGARVVYAVTERADEDLSQIIPQRALKPANIMAVGEELQISSDGICSARETSGRGKPSAYDAPESGTRGDSAAGDVWSLGVTLVEVLTQRLPTWEWKGQEEPELPKVLPAPFGDIARQCMRRDPQRRCTLPEIASRLDPDAPALGTQIRVEQRPVAPPVVQTPKVKEALKPRVEVAKPRPAAAKVSSGAPKRGYAIPAIAIAAAALIVIFAAPKLLNRSRAALREAEASAPEKPKAVLKAQAKPKATETRPASEKLVAKRLDSGGAAPMAAAGIPQPKPAPVTRKPLGEFVRGAVAHQVLPDVPQSASETIRGTVRVSVRVQVDASGKVVGADLDAAGPSKYFANLALKAARGWEFTPAKVGGEDAPSEWILRFDFAQDGTNVSSAERAPT